MLRSSPLYFRTATLLRRVRSLPSYSTPRFESKNASVSQHLLQFTRLEWKRTNDRIWTLLTALWKSSRTQAIATSLEECGVDDNAQRQWTAVVASEDIQQAISQLIANGHVDPRIYMERGDANPPSSPPPTWLIMDLISRKVRSAGQANIATSLALSELPRTDPRYQASLLILALHAISKFNVVTSVRHITSVLLELPSLPDHILREAIMTVARMPITNEVEKQLLLLLEALHQRKSKFQWNQFSYLMQRFSPSEALQLQLVRQMHTQRAWANEAVLGSLLRGAAYRGDAEGAKKLLNKIRELRLANMEGKVIPIDLDDPHSKGELSHWNLTALSANKRGWTQVLTRLLKARPATWRHAGTERMYWSIVLSTLARQRSVSVDDLLATFRQAPRKAGTYTAVIRGLTDRGEHELACQLWDELRRSRLTIDRDALIAGVRALASNGKLVQAFQTMDSMARKRHTEDMDRRGKVTLGPGNINTIMVAAEKAGMSDVVFRLWDWMDMYNVQPSESLLTIVLRVAARASQNEESVSDSLTQLFPFILRRHSSPQDVVDEERSQKISEMLSDTFGQRSGLWNGRPAWIVARDLFNENLLTHYPELKSIESPANAPQDDDTWADAFIKQAQTPPMSFELKYPLLVPTIKSFNAYIQLIGQNDAKEIPQTLAWMREIGIEPRVSTLLTSLMYFGDVARLPPLFERFDRSAQGGEYGRLRRWIEAWVGKDAVPSEQVIAAERTRAFARR